MKLGPQIQPTVPGQGNILQPVRIDTWARGLRWAPGDPVSTQGDGWQSAGQPCQSQEVKGRTPLQGSSPRRGPQAGGARCLNEDPRGHLPAPRPRGSDERSQRHEAQELCEMRMVNPRQARRTIATDIRDLSLGLTGAKGFCQVTRQRMGAGGWPECLGFSSSSATDCPVTLGRPLYPLGSDSAAK